ncbi:MAG: GNAT family N-acetyltransferase [Ignavibacteria bacterium]|nr:GNAT family N-acetyltransferase [Ignavibacteria bacterium]
MSATEIIQLTPDRFSDFIDLVFALAEYEKLDAPNAAAVERLYKDAFSKNPRYEAFLAFNGGKPAGYAIIFETYSSFLAKPTLYLEDLFVLEECRGLGVGGVLFNHVKQIGAQRGCGRMDWQVLDWNKIAIDFYKHKNATWLKEWHTYRITF